MRILVCGGRNYSERSTLFFELDKILKSIPHDSLTIIEGGASGADKLAQDWCKVRFVPFDHFPADWDKHGKAAGPIRNQRMIDEGRPDLVVAFTGGKGTADMVSRAKASGIEVREIETVAA